MSGVRVPATPSAEERAREVVREVYGGDKQGDGLPPEGGLLISRIAAALTEAVREATSRPWLGNATTAELLDELRARIEMHHGGLEYRTVDK